MAYINDSAFDAALNWIISKGLRLDICSQEPTTYAQATSTYSIGNKVGPSLGAVANGATSGRRTTVAAITDGTVTATATATHWALTDASSILAATGALAASQALTSGNPFTTPAFDITFPDAV